MKKFLYFLIISTIILTSCANNFNNITEQNICIEPFMFSYPTSGYEKNNTLTVQPTTPPMYPWIEVSNIPKTTSTTDTIQLITFQNDVREIWINRQKKDNDNELLIYNLSTNEWKTLNRTTQKGEFIPDVIFESLDNSIWGLENWPSESKSPILSKYNRKTLQFELIPDASNKLQGNFYGFQQKEPPLIDKSGYFWFLKFDRIYKFNSMSYEIEEYLFNYEEINSYLSNSFVIDNNGNLYVLLQNAKEILYFDTSNKSYNRITIRLNLPQSHEIPDGLLANSIFLDKENRLWINDYGWMEENLLWHQVTSRFEGFFSPPMAEIQNYYWNLPIVTLESFDGRLWFRSDNGMTWLDPDKGEWCWFTTYQSNIVEDSERNLWMIADNKLYKLPLGEQ